MRFTYTSHLRQDDAGILTIGAREGKSQIIPPHYSDFKSIAVGSEECLSSVKISKYFSNVWTMISKMSDDQIKLLFFYIEQEVLQLIRYGRDRIAVGCTMQLGSYHS